MTVIGVVGNFLNAGLAMPPSPQILALFRQQADLNYGFKEIVLRTALDPLNIATAVSQQLRSLDADVPLAEIPTMADHLNDQMADVRFTTLLLALFAGLGMLLSVIGAYGVISYLVAHPRAGRPKSPGSGLPQHTLVSYCVRGSRWA
jgi:hypothetical protein